MVTEQERLGAKAKSFQAKKKNTFKGLQVMEPDAN